MSGQLVKHMVKVAALTIAGSVLVLETVGPLFGIHGFIGPQVANWLDEQPPTTTQPVPSETPSGAGEDDPGAPSPLRPGSPQAVAMESCVTALNAVSLHPKFNRIPFVEPTSEGNNIVYEWTANQPVVAMAVDGREVRRTAYCEVVPGGDVAELMIDGRLLAADEAGRSSITNNWQVIRAVSGIDGSTNVSVIGNALHALADGTTVPQLVLHCGEDKTVAYLKADIPLGEPRAAMPVTTVADGQESTADWSISEDGLNAFVSGQYIPFIRDLMRADTFLLRFTDTTGTQQEAPFDPHGVTAAVAPLQEACHWQ